MPSRALIKPSPCAAGSSKQTLARGYIIHVRAAAYTPAPAPLPSGSIRTPASDRGSWMLFLFGIIQAMDCGRSSREERREGEGRPLPCPTMQREMEMVDVDLTAGDDIVLESLPAQVPLSSPALGPPITSSLFTCESNRDAEGAHQGRVNFRAICGAAGKELGPPVIELDAISKVYTLPGRDEEVAALRSISMKVPALPPPHRLWTSFLSLASERASSQSSRAGVERGVPDPERRVCAAPRALGRRQDDAAEYHWLHRRSLFRHNPPLWRRLKCLQHSFVKCFLQRND